jgi:hypothetical protein
MPPKYSAEKREELARSRGIIVDPEDEWLLRHYTWSICTGGYARTPLAGRFSARLHHCIVGQPIRDDEQIDHIDRNPRNNRRSNLRYVSRKVNSLNSNESDNASHIYPVTRSTSYQVIIVRDQIRNYLGYQGT